MRPNRIPPRFKVLLQGELEKQASSRDRDKIKALIAVASGQTAPEAARLTQRSVRTVEHWVQRFLEVAMNSLVRERPGPKTQVSKHVLEEVIAAMKQRPKEFLRAASDTRFTGEIIALYIKNRYAVPYGVRTGQRFLERLRRLKRRGDPRFDIPHL